MSRFATRTPPTYVEASAAFWFKDTAMYRTYRLAGDPTPYRFDENLFETWPESVSINGHQWPFLKVVFLLQHKRWPNGPVSYPHPPLKPALITER